MNTPICDFVRRYAEENHLRLHMPGHKGTGPLGIEQLDITEIYGADSPENAAKRVSQAKDEGCRIIFITDEFAEGISDPAVIPLPAKNGRYGYKRMSEATVKAIGSDIIYKEKR